MCCYVIVLRISFERCKKRSVRNSALSYGLRDKVALARVGAYLGNSLNQLGTSQLTLPFLPRKVYILLEEIKDYSFLLLEIILKTDS